MWLVWMDMRLVYATSNYIIETYFVLFRIIFYIPVSLMWFTQVIVLCYFLKLCLFLRTQNTFFKLVGKFSLTPMQLKPFTVQLYFVGNITISEWAFNAWFTLYDLALGTLYLYFFQILLGVSCCRWTVTFVSAPLGNLSEHNQIPGCKQQQKFGRRGNRGIFREPLWLDSVLAYPDQLLHHTVSLVFFLPWVSSASLSLLLFYSSFCA